MNYKLIAKKGELTRHLPYERLIDLFTASDIYREMGYEVETYMKNGETWEMVKI